MVLSMFNFKFLCECISSPPLLGYISRGGIAVPHGNTVFIILWNCQTVCQVTAPLSIPPAMDEGLELFLDRLLMEAKMPGKAGYNSSV